ncbi:MAG: DUF4249 family protein [Saprospiraceae bacterium]|jgi:hypothetical protein|nr:DUF4249 family protein [Saprospiraceae bacterium]
MRIARILILCLTLLLLARCAREVIIDLPETAPRVVAICHFTTGQHFRANITMSQPVNEGDDPEQPTGVDATLSVNGEFYDLLFKVKGDGNDYFWRSHLHKLATAGVEYSFVVKVPGYPTVQASSSIPAHHPIESIVLDTSDVTIETLSDGSKEMRIPLELRLKDLPQAERYFAFYLTHDTDIYESREPDIFDYTQEQQPTNFLADGRTISLLHNIPEPVVLINEKYWADERRTLYLVARIPYNPQTDTPRRLYITWRTLSKEFYRYHLSLSRQGGNVPLNDPDAVFNNMDGGLGNFSGYSVEIDTVEIPEF